VTLELSELEIVNFRSIRGRLTAPLDAKVVLIHGENGAGKTSFLSAIELALTGKVQALRRADPNYAAQLLHRTTSAGRVAVRAQDADGPVTFASTLGTAGLTIGQTLAAGPSGFFSERCYLPQTLLGQLLQIYQESDSGQNSPLAKFVGSLLGLDQLDTLETGLKNLGDIRNVRKLASDWGDVEVEKAKLERTLADTRKSLDAIQKEIDATNVEIAAAALHVGVPFDAALEDALPDVLTAFNGAHDETVLGVLVDQRRQLDSIRREAERNAATDGADAAALSAAASAAQAELEAWRTAHGARMLEVRTRMLRLAPTEEFPQDLAAFHAQALSTIRREQVLATERSSRAALDASRLVTARDELIVAEAQLDTIDLEIARIGANSSGLGAALAELTRFISDDLCPVCDRNYSDLQSGLLVDHVHHKVRTLSGSAQRLLSLSRTRGEQQVLIETLRREISTLTGRALDSRELADLGRVTAAFHSGLAELEAVTVIAAEGARLETEDVAARRLLAEHQARDLDAQAAMQTLRDYAAANGQDAPSPFETVTVAAARLASMLAERIADLEQRLSVRFRGRELILTLQNQIERRDTFQQAVTRGVANWQQTEAALSRGQSLRADGQSIRNAIDTVRSGIIRAEFNDRLNRLWRDLFVRLAPGEPFVPAFSIPEGNTQRLQPKLITLHREGGDAGGTPGAMLSSGNLNTATLTLFMAMHMSVPTQLPWLILDDPVQSMDDVHIAHFAALLRTLAKEHGRQVMLAVHDRQLFEYLKLELSPAYPDDSLLTLELSRGSNRDTSCLPTRLSFKEETALRTAA
jgi:exonuclease SbcC